MPEDFKNINPVDLVPELYLKPQKPNIFFDKVKHYASWLKERASDFWYPERVVQNAAAVLTLHTIGIERILDREINKVMDEGFDAELLEDEYRAKSFLDSRVLDPLKFLSDEKSNPKEFDPTY